MVVCSASILFVVRTGARHQHSRLAFEGGKALPAANLQQWAMWWFVEPPFFFVVRRAPSPTFPDFAFEGGSALPAANLQQWAMCKWWFVEPPFFFVVRMGALHPTFQIGF
jgi:hypothetical protein